MVKLIPSAAPGSQVIQTGSAARWFPMHGPLISVVILCLAIVSLAACTGKEPRVATEGDTVQVHYRGTLDNGEEFDSSRGRDPLQFTVGEGQVIKGFDDAVRGLAVGEDITVRLEPAEAYGEPREDLVIDVPKDQAPEGLSPGDQVSMSTGARAVVTDVTDESVRIDANHELAGKALTFEIELVAID